jgi:hypothetical protein
MENRVIYCLIDENNTPFYIGKSYKGSTRKYHHKLDYPNCEFVEIDEVDKDHWKYWETYWIEQFKQWGFNLKNQNTGGGGPAKGTPKPEGWVGRKGMLASKETCKKMSMAHKDIPLSEQHKRNISDAMMGHTKDKKWKKNLSKSATKSFGKPVLQLDLDGNLIKEWETGKLASQELNIGYSAINQCCVKNNNIKNRTRDKNKIGKYTSHSYIWIYKNHK